MTYGRQLITPTSGLPVRVSADGSPEYKPGGITLDWATVAAATADTVLGDGNTIPSGGKGLEYGTVVCLITASGKYGPYASGAADGRQTLTRGACYILDESVIQGGVLAVSQATTHPAVIEGGLVWQDRLKIDAVGTATKPSTAAFNVAFPRIRYANI
jgi:hypothetical protein